MTGGFPFTRDDKLSKVVLDDQEFAVANVEPKTNVVKQKISVCVNVIMLAMCIMMIMGLLLITVGMLERYRAHPGHFNDWYNTDLKTKDGKKHEMKHHAEIIPKEETAKITVPKIGQFRHAVFVHDFAQKLTGILDVGQNFCMIKPLTKTMKPPSNLIDLISKMKDHYFDVNATHLNESYKIVSPKMNKTQFESLKSKLIHKTCAGKDTYQLVKKNMSGKEDEMKCKPVKRNYGFHDTQVLHGTEVVHC